MKATLLLISLIALFFMTEAHATNQTVRNDITFSNDILNFRCH